MKNPSGFAKYGTRGEANKHPTCVNTHKDLVDDELNLEGFAKYGTRGEANKHPTCVNTHKDLVDDELNLDEQIHHLHSRLPIDRI